MLVQDNFSENIANPYFQKNILKGDKICKNSTDAVSVAAVLLYIDYTFQYSNTSTFIKVCIYLILSFI